jgi:hypothetical protein
MAAISFGAHAFPAAYTHWCEETHAVVESVIPAPAGSLAS